jgi:phosphate transport system substrate-binding protein
MKMRRLYPSLVLFLLAFSPVHAADTLLLNGAGATFPYPLYSKWFSEYGKADPSVRINYQSIGSGGGIRQFLEKTVDFGASDAPMTDEQLAKATSPVLHLPTVLGAVVVTYNVQGLSGLKLTGPLVADIFLGKITKWNDARIKELNPTASLPDTSMLVVHRSDGSGTTAVFTDYLAKVSEEWKSKVGAGSSVAWPAGLGGKGNEGVTALLKQTPGSIGYVELTYAQSNKLEHAALKNKAGSFVVASPKAVSNAAAAMSKKIPADYRVSITDAEGKDSYPISSFTYLLTYKSMDLKKAQKFVSFMEWALKDGQKFAEPMSYAPLPAALVGKVQKTLTEIKTK